MLVATLGLTLPLLWATGARAMLAVFAARLFGLGILVFIVFIVVQVVVLFVQFVVAVASSVVFGLIADQRYNTHPSFSRVLKEARLSGHRRLPSRSHRHKRHPKTAHADKKERAAGETRTISCLYETHKTLLDDEQILIVGWESAAGEEKEKSVSYIAYERPN
jgi:hypothetical protein